jgi:hypothetical protein
MEQESKKRGRPQGKTEEKPVVIVRSSHCPACGSPNRSNYYNTRSLDYGQIVDGREYRRVIWRDTQCTDCGQRRCDKTLE